MDTLLGKPADAKQLSPLTLAFLGDAVYSLLVRERLACEANRPAGALHTESVRYVNAAAQSEAAQKLMPMLSEEETAAFRRGRNAQPAHTAKNTGISDYHQATGLEALFGYLYLQGRIDRIRELFDYTA